MVEEKRLACAYLAFFYRFIRAEPAGSPYSGSGVEGEVEGLYGGVGEFIIVTCLK